MNISNANFFVSLLNPETSGTVEFKFNQLKIEIDVKHSVYDRKGVPLTLFNIERYPNTIVVYNWLPLPWNCQGLRINLFWYK